jgi:hypothetical protein
MQVLVGHIATIPTVGPPQTYKFQPELKKAIFLPELEIRRSPNHPPKALLSMVF